MSVLIKGMEMPTSCRACMFSRTDIRNVDWCVLTEKDLPCDCPIVPVPDHGRLIDADALQKERWFLQRTVHGFGYYRIEGKDIKDVPTIIPADGNLYDSLKRGLEQAINGESRSETIQADKEGEE